MKPKFQTSFIPKRPVIDGSKSTFPVVKNINIFSTIATVLFALTLLVSGGLLGYKYYLTKQIVDADKALNEARAAFEPEKIKELLNASTKIYTIKNLLNDHFVVSELLVLLEQLTLKNTRFNNLTYKNNQNVISINLDGDARTYNALAQQSDIFNRSGFFQNQVFSDFSLSDTGTVKFRYSANILPELVSYKKVTELLSPNQ